MRLENLHSLSPIRHFPDPNGEATFEDENVDETAPREEAASCQILGLCGRFRIAGAMPREASDHGRCNSTDLHETSVH